MKCPYCSYGETKVVDSRESENGSFVRRRRECIKCGKRFTTYERMERSFVVIKKDMRREPYQRNKLTLGIEKACEKRPVSQETIERMLDEIENELHDLGKNEIESKIIGDRVIEKLKMLDHVAYIRFASVYKQFEDLSSFEEELKKLKGE
ncbi:MAG: transcriptional repressor NrdR [Methanomicrobia archaeon]|nr:transcriptional repressor NrdR [Methanomicrobia archaeon]MCK4433751.1 transcriptional repressor NrdR [Methanomicrobia archaeon]